MEPQTSPGQRERPCYWHACSIPSPWAQGQCHRNLTVRKGVTSSMLIVWRGGRHQPGPAVLGAPTVQGRLRNRRMEGTAFGANPLDRNLPRVQKHHRKPKWFKSGSSSDGCLCKKRVMSGHSQGSHPNPTCGSSGSQSSLEMKSF